MKVSVSRHLVDKHFTVVEANDFYYELIGYTREEYEAAFHNHCNEYFKTNEGSWEKIHSRIEEMYAAGKTSYELFVPLKPVSYTHLDVYKRQLYEYAYATKGS